MKSVPVHCLLVAFLTILDFLRYFKVVETF